MQGIVAVVETALYADDLDRSAVFYQDVLGLKMIGTDPGRHVFFQVGSESVLLLFRPEATLRGDVLAAYGARGAGHCTLAIPAEDLVSWEERLG